MVQLHITWEEGEWQSGLFPLEVDNSWNTQLWHPIPPLSLPRSSHLPSVLSDTPTKNPPKLSLNFDEQIQMWAKIRWPSFVSVCTFRIFLTFFWATTTMTELLSETLLPNLWLLWSNEEEQFHDRLAAVDVIAPLSIYLSIFARMFSLSLVILSVTSWTCSVENRKRKANGNSVTLAYCHWYGHGSSGS